MQLYENPHLRRGSARTTDNSSCTKITAQDIKLLWCMFKWFYEKCYKNNVDHYYYYIINNAFAIIIIIFRMSNWCLCIQISVKVHLEILMEDNKIKAEH